jgi:hypothetical protein
LGFASSPYLKKNTLIYIRQTTLFSIQNLKPREKKALSGNSRAKQGIGMNLQNRKTGAGFFGTKRRRFFEEKLENENLTDLEFSWKRPRTFLAFHPCFRQIIEQFIVSTWNSFSENE